MGRDNNDSMKVQMMSDFKMMKVDREKDDPGPWITKVDSPRRIF
jgi:hypothetical protein